MFNKSCPQDKTLEYNYKKVLASYKTQTLNFEKAIEQLSEYVDDSSGAYRWVRVSENDTAFREFHVPWQKQVVNQVVRLEARLAQARTAKDLWLSKRATAEKMLIDSENAMRRGVQPKHFRYHIRLPISPFFVLICVHISKQNLRS